MKHVRTFFIFLFLLVPFTAHGQSSAAVQVKSESASSTTETVQFESKLAGMKLPYNVVLPPDYAQGAARGTRYPVLYLLHGLTGHYSDWLAKSKLTAHAAQHQFIIITPEGNNGWYTDSPVAPTDKYETYIIQELIPDVQRRFRAIEASADVHPRSLAERRARGDRVGPGCAGDSRMAEAVYRARLRQNG